MVTLGFHAPSFPQHKHASVVFVLPSCVSSPLSSPRLCLAVVYFGWRAVGPSTPTSSVHVFHASCKSRPRLAAASQTLFPRHCARILWLWRLLKIVCGHVRFHIVCVRLAKPVVLEVSIASPDLFGSSPVRLPAHSARQRDSVDPITPDVVEQFVLRPRVLEHFVEVCGSCMGQSLLLVHLLSL